MNVRLLTVTLCLGIITCSAAASAVISPAQGAAARADLERLWNQAPRPRLIIAPVDQPVQIEGQNVEIRESATVADAFIRVPLTPGQEVWALEEAEAPTSVHIAYDNEHLYLFWTCHEPRMDDLRAEVAERDGAVPEDDAVMLAMDLPDRENPAQRRVIQIIVNAANTIRDSDNTRGDEQWQVDGLRTDVQHDEDAWHVTMAIPFAGLDVDPPQAGDVWLTNFGRERHPVRERSYWSGQPEPRLDLPARFGEVRFGDLAVPDVQFPQPFLGRHEGELTLRNAAEQRRQLDITIADAFGADEDEILAGPGQVGLRPDGSVIVDVVFTVRSEGTQIAYLKIEEEGEALAVYRRTFRVPPLTEPLAEQIAAFEALLEEQDEEWELRESVERQVPRLEALADEVEQFKQDGLVYLEPDRLRRQWQDFRRHMHQLAADTEWFQPLALYLTWQRDPTTTMTIHWHSHAADRHNTVQYQQEGEDRWHTRSGIYRPMPYTERYIHTVDLGGLEPGTDYRFRFGPALEEYRFRTMPDDATEPIRFLSGGDTMHRREWFERMTREGAKHDPMFAIIGGDLAYADGRPDRFARWFDWLDVATNDFVTSDGRRIPIIVAIGNHEVSGAFYQRGATAENAPYFFSLFAFPGLPGYNVLDFGDYMSVIALDTGHVNPLDGHQTQWLKRVLEQRRHVTHIFPFYHVPGYPSHRAYDGIISPEVREHWAPLFEEYGVRVSFENHDHTFKRTHPIRGEQIDPRGVIYVGDGCWGVGPRTIHDADETWYLARSRSIHHLFVVTVQDQRVQVMAVDIDGEIFDEFSIDVTEPVELAAELLEETEREDQEQDPAVEIEKD